MREWLERKGVDFLAVCGESASSQCVAVKVGRRHPVRAFRSKEVAQMIDWLNLTETALARVLLLKDAIERERISSAGIMASGLAHEIRNPLMALKTGAEMLVEHSGDKVFLEEFATVLKDEIIHIEEMAEQLMNLTVPTKPILDRIDLNSVVRASVRLLSKRLRRLNISLVDETGDTPMTVTGNASAIGQVIVNLVINAQQAIAPAAKVRVVTIRTIRSGSETYLEVEDSGAGVPADQRANIFRPFTSTKVGGFGIGLPVCENIMRNHSGSIALLDTEGATTFRLTFME